MRSVQVAVQPLDAHPLGISVCSRRIALSGQHGCIALGLDAGLALGIHSISQLHVRSLQISQLLGLRFELQASLGSFDLRRAAQVALSLDVARQALDLRATLLRRAVEL
jgi:hypothetical protein